MLIKANDNHLDILFRWVRYSSKFNLSDVLKNHGIHNIAIYGGGALGVALYENLVASLNIKYIIDKNPDLSFPYDVQTILPAETEFLNELDAVIVTVDFNNVEERLSNYVRCISLDELIINLDEYLLFEKVARHVEKCGATILYADLFCPLYYIKNPSQFEKIKKYGGPNWSDLYNDKVLLDYYDDLEYCSLEYCKDVFTARAPIALIKKGNVTYLSDVNLKYFNVINNCRITTDVPDKYDNTIHFFGNCVSVGFFAEDRYTLESHLQRMLNEMPIMNKAFQIVNRSNWHNYRESLLQILDTSFQRGDYIVLIGNVAKFQFYHPEDMTVKYTNLVSAFDRPHEYGDKEIFFDGYHINHRGYKLLANKLYNTLKELLNTTITNDNAERLANPIADNVPNAMPIHGTPKEHNHDELNDYLDFLRNERITCDGIIGSIVMNCNPFTLGHRFIVEKALQNCDFLYIFIVEEDKSFFPFKERLECVKKGVADITNVKVLPSGKFIISSLTFPEYFVKEQSRITVDTSLDIELFAKHMAPILNIKRRFVGEEPFCQITRQYNRAMAENLPRYGIELIIFDRKEVDSVPISASKVRELFNSKNFEELKSIVPECTFNYLTAFSKGH